MSTCVPRYFVVSSLLVRLFQQVESCFREARRYIFNPSIAHQLVCRSEAVFKPQRKARATIRAKWDGFLGIAIAIREGLP